MHENEIDLDVLRDLSKDDWKEMGITANHIQPLMSAAKTLPPGSYCTWGKNVPAGTTGANAVASAVKQAMHQQTHSQQASPPGGGGGFVRMSGQDAKPAKPETMARFGSNAQKAAKPTPTPNDVQKGSSKLSGVLLEDIGASKVSRPTTEFGVKQELAKELMVKGQECVSKKRFQEALKKFEEAEALFQGLNDTKMVMEANTKKSQAQLQLKMYAQEQEANENRAKTLVMNGLKALKNDQCDEATDCFISAEKMYTESGNHAAKQEIVRMKQQAEARKEELAR
eukprot:295218-Rhodomonas_salina.1